MWTKGNQSISFSCVRVHGKWSELSLPQQNTSTMPLKKKKLAEYQAIYLKSICSKENVSTVGSAAGE